MKILAINGSARKNGNTDILIRRFLEKFNDAGIETEAVQFAGNRIEPCKACFAMPAEKETVSINEMISKPYLKK